MEALSLSWPVTALLAMGGLGVGLAVGRLWPHPKRPALAAPAKASSAKGDEEAARKPAPSPIEIHLVLNVLNRMGMALVYDEQAQDGIAGLADYLADLSRLRNQAAGGDPVAAKAPIENYLRLSEWQQGLTSPAVLTWDSSGRIRNAVGIWYLVDAIQQMLRGIEGLPMSTIRIRLEVREPVDGQPQSARIDIDAESSSPLPAALTKADGRGWRPKGDSTLSANQVLTW